jgi:prepilin-type N-terminal cleavage/methylation domain-containing protein
MTRRVRSIRGEAGFSLIEMMVSTAVLLLVTGTVFSLLSPSTTTYKAQPEAADMQQRMRVGTNALSQDLVMAGAGTYSGLAVGTLLSYFAPVVPYKLGTFINDIADGVTYRPDAITIMYVPQTAAQTTIREAMPQPSSEVKVNAQPGCPNITHDALCGFEQGMRVVIFDETGAYDPFTVTQVQDDALHLQHRDDNFSKSYQLGAVITQVVSHIYYLREDVAAGRFQLMHYNGYDRDEPLVVDVVARQVGY